MNSKKEWPLVSVIIPCYNGESYLQKSIGSVLDQTYKHWELIVVDDGSTDRSKLIVEPYAKEDDRIKYYYQQNKGLPGARNAGASRSTGIYLFFLDCDDWISPLMLEQGVSYLTDHKETTLFYGKTLWCDEKNMSEHVGYAYCGYRNLLLYGLDCRSMMRRTDFERIGGFDEEMRTGVEDWEFFVRMLYKDKVVHVSDDVLYYYRVNSNPNSLSKQQTSRIEQLTNIIYQKNQVIYQEVFGSPIFMARYREEHQWSERRLPQLARKLQVLYGKVLRMLGR